MRRSGKARDRGRIAEYVEGNHTGETWDVENLFVSDASTFPTALGVNPQLTIMVQALRIAGHIDERLGG